MTAPLVKWVGGKTKLLPELVKRMPSTYRRYYEPFFGGGALFFHLRPQNAVLSDWNAPLIDTYMAVRDDPTLVIRSLCQMQWRHNQPYYHAQRDRWNFRTSPPMAQRTRHYFAALFLYLNRTCFNGLWRVNSKGEFNVPMGRFQLGHTICDAPRIKACSIALQGATLARGDYWHSCSNAKRGDFVYFDPPYDPVSASSSFTGYTDGGFGRDEQERLAECAKILVRWGVTVMLSNSDTKFIRKLYRTRGFTIHKVSAPRAINSDATKRGNVSELIITGGY